MSHTHLASGDLLSTCHMPDKTPSVVYTRITSQSAPKGTFPGVRTGSHARPICLHGESGVMFDGAGALFGDSLSQRVTSG